MQNQFNLYLSHLQNGNTDATFYHASLDELLKWIKKEPDKQNLFVQIDLAKKEGLYKLEQKLLHQSELLEDERGLTLPVIQYIIKRLEAENSQMVQEPKIDFRFLTYVPAGIDPKKMEEIDRAQAEREGKEYNPKEHRLHNDPPCEVREGNEKAYDLEEELRFTSLDGTFRILPGCFTQQQINWMLVHKTHIPPEHDDPILDDYKDSREHLIQLAHDDGIYDFVPPF